MKFWKIIKTKKMTENSPGTKNSNGKFFRDQKVRKKSLGIKNEILKNYRDNLLI
jgi:hypothetical protein